MRCRTFSISFQGDEIMTIGPAPDWTNVTWLIGNYEGTPTLMAVDDEGNMVAVMKGWDGTDLTTLLTDEDGRLIAILTDPEDVWGTYQHMGLAELAARLGSLVSYDRRGNVVWLTDFTHGLQGVTPGVDNVASTVRITPLTSYVGGFSLEFDPRAAASSYGNYRRVLYPLIGGKVGAEFTFSFQPDPVAITFRIQYFDGDYRYPGEVTYTVADKDWTVLDDASDDVLVLENAEVQTGYESWHTLKVVIDTVTKKYHRLLIDGDVVDVSDISLLTVADTGLGVIDVKFEVQGSATAHAPGYLDSIIVTQNEPD